MTRTHRIALALGLALCGLVQPAGEPALAQGSSGRRDQESRREEQQRVPDVLKAMGVAPGAVVADIGAGQGFYTVRLARAVGETGRVYAVDVSAQALRSLRARVKEESLSNVEVIEGEPADPKLPEATLDAALIVNAYHEMKDGEAILTQIHRALKPGGRLVILEPISPGRRDATREEQTKQHEIAPEFVKMDAEGAGFAVVSLQDPFSNHHGHGNEYLLVLTPAGGDIATASIPRR